jgi:hypothetical protein
VSGIGRMDSFGAGKPGEWAANRPHRNIASVTTNTGRQQHGTDSYELSVVETHRPPIDKLVREADQLMILASENDLVAALRAFWWRTVPIWEGHTRESLAPLVGSLTNSLVEYAGRRTSAAASRALAQSRQPHATTSHPGVARSDPAAPPCGASRAQCRVRR